MDIAKICLKCAVEKELCEFPKRKDSKSGYYTYCKQCCRAQRKQYRLDNLELERERDRLRNMKPERIEYREKYRKQYYIDNRESILQHNKEYYQTHKSQTNMYIQKRRLNDEQFRLTCNLRNRVRKVLKGINKSESTLQLLVCSIEHLYYWLISQLQDGQKLSQMEADHVTPCASFDLSKPEEQLQCFGWWNTMPLTPEENKKKGNRRNLELEHKQKVKADSFQLEKFSTPFGVFVVTVSEYI